MIEEDGLEEGSDPYDDDDYDYYDDDEDEEEDPDLQSIDWDKIDDLGKKFQNKLVYITNLDFPFHNSDHQIDGVEFGYWHRMQCVGHEFFDAEASYLVTGVYHISSAFPWENEISVRDLMDAWGSDGLCAYIRKMESPYPCYICVPLSCIALQSDRGDGLAAKKAAKMEKRGW